MITILQGDHSNPRRNMIPQAVLMRSGIKAVNTAKPKDAHNAVKRNRFNTVKASACWVWMPKNRVIDHGRNNAQIDEDHFGSDGCTDSGEAGVQQRQKIMMKGRGFPEQKVNHKFRGGLLGIKLSALSTAKSKTVEGLKTAGYKVTTAGSRLLLLVKKLMLLVQSNSSPHAHGQAAKTYYTHQDSRIKKAQDSKTKTFATLIFKIFLKDIKIIKTKIFKGDCNGYSLKDKNEAKTDKTKHGIGKSMKSQSQRRVHLKWANPFDKEDPHAHIRYFNKITSTLKYKDVPETCIKLMLFPSSIDGPAQLALIPAILAENFELKHGLLNLVTSKQFYGFEKEDPHAHIRWFNKITSTIKYRDVPNSSIKLMLFPFSIEGAARIWLEKEPPRSILTWEDLVSKFINQFFPPSKTTNLRNEITNFQQRFDESFCEAWDRFKDLLRACPHHSFTELHQLDTFYNALTPTD
ncbi:reverse transcriptase domain-containing protein [Tanacetum coccineum]